MNLSYGTTADAELFSQLGAKTFYDTFAEYNTPEIIESYIKRSFSPETQFKELSAPDVVFIIGEEYGDPIGYVQLVLGSKDDSTPYYLNNLPNPFPSVFCIIFINFWASRNCLTRRFTS